MAAFYTFYNNNVWDKRMRNWWGLGVGGAVGHRMDADSHINVMDVLYRR